MRGGDKGGVQKKAYVVPVMGRFIFLNWKDHFSEKLGKVGGGGSFTR